MPIGDKPEDFEPLPSDFKKINEADIFFVNGLGLEKWLEQVISNMQDVEIIYLTERVQPISLEDGSGTDPHEWLSVNEVINHYVTNITEELIRLDPEGKEEYRENAKA